jgi:hypothetical protein
MNYRIFIVTAVILAAFLLSAGCTQTPVTPPATTVPTTVGTPVPTTVLPTTAVPTTPACSLTPGPVDKIPDYDEVTVNVIRNTVSINPTITTIFQGGKGMNHVVQMKVMVTRSDCTTEEQQIMKPAMGNEIVITGTTGTDRVEIWVTMADGNTYKIYDQAMPFRSYG